MQNPRQAKYYVGDLVRLKSGGPALTISSLIFNYKHYNADGSELKGPFIPSHNVATTESIFTGEYEVQWFGESNNSLNNTTLIEEVLKKHEIRSNHSKDYSP